MFVFAFFVHAVTHWLLLAGPTPGADNQERDKKPRQRLPLSLSAAVTVLAFAGF